MRFRALLASFALSALFLPAVPGVAPAVAASPAGCDTLPVDLMCADLSASFSGRICMTAWEPDCRFTISYFMSCSTIVPGGGTCFLHPSHSGTETCTWGATQFGCSIAHSDGFAQDSPDHSFTASGSGRHAVGLTDSDTEEDCIEEPGSTYCP